ncbi:GTP-binding protein [Clathrus columnatus]|uniref:GTP-binding protein n=1 Tax=Clathrus columnatus TaxID=1419009 RepID=A0AAV4ZZ24_9AGAM|nr:GTP-binding protein [Clathrus columnatus]
MSSDSLKKRKIAVLGSRSVGKSSLVVQYTDNHFVEAYYPTIENTFTKGINLKGIEYDCDIIDTAGQDEYSILNHKHAIGVHGYVLVYSVASRASFEMVRIVYDKIINFCGLPAIPCVIVGQKRDLNRYRQVSEKEGQDLAASVGSAWIETSARNNENVAQVFELCLNEIEKARRGGTAPSDNGKCFIM